MSYDFAIWKRSAETKTAMLAEAYASICDGDCHSAMAHFELQSLEQAVKAEFGDYTVEVDGPIICASGSTQTASWMIVHCSHSAATDISSRLVPIALALGLLVYDPQRSCVWGNKRPSKPSTGSRGAR